VESKAFGLLWNGGKPWKGTTRQNRKNESKVEGKEKKGKLLNSADGSKTPQTAFVKRGGKKERVSRLFTADLTSAEDGKVNLFLGRQEGETKRTQADNSRAPGNKPAPKKTGGKGPRQKPDEGKLAKGKKGEEKIDSKRVEDPFHFGKRTT